MWIDDLPLTLKSSVENLISKHPKSKPVLSQMAAHYTSIGKHKRHKGNLGKTSQVSEIISSTSDTVNVSKSHEASTKSKWVSDYILDITSPLNDGEIIFKLPALSFISPIRRKLDLTFHICFADKGFTHPVLSVVNSFTQIPEISVTNLQSAIKMCMILPILGNSTLPKKRDTVMMALWLHESAIVAEGKHDPIICSINLDVVKKFLVETGKISAHIEAQTLKLAAVNEAIKPINELIVDFLQRQFSSCGVKLFNFLPSETPGRNSLNVNDDILVCISQTSTMHNNLVMTAAHKGSKEGVILLVSTSPDNAFFIFGFKRGGIFFNFTSLKTISYGNITRFTFSMLINRIDEEGNEESYDFGMIDQKAFRMIDEFVKRMNIKDNSLDEKHREKRSYTKEYQQISISEGGSALARVKVAISDDDEEDSTYSGSVQEEGSVGELDEEYYSGPNFETESNIEEDEEDEEDDEEEGKAKVNTAKVGELK